MQRTIRSVALALALLILTAGAVHARPLAVHPAPAGFLAALWQWAAPYLPHWSTSGSSMDPDGARHNLLAPIPKSDSGGAMDPDGARHNLLTPLSTSDSGGAMDPNG